MFIFMNVIVCENGDYVFFGWVRVFGLWWLIFGYFVVIWIDVELNIIWEFVEIYGSCLLLVGWDMVEGIDGWLFFVFDMVWMGCYDVFGYIVMMEFFVDG